MSEDKTSFSACTSGPRYALRWQTTPSAETFRNILDGGNAVELGRYRSR